MKQGYKSKSASSAQESNLEAFEAANAMERSQKHGAIAVFKLMVETNCANLMENTFKTWAIQNSACLNPRHKIARNGFFGGHVDRTDTERKLAI